MTENKFIEAICDCDYRICDDTIAECSKRWRVQDILELKYEVIR